MSVFKYSDQRSELLRNSELSAKNSTFRRIRNGKEQKDEGEDRE